MLRHGRRRLYLLTPPVIDDAARFSDILAGLLAEDIIAALQIRLKHADDATICALAELVMPAMRAAGVMLIINDRPDLAVAVGADGAHLGPEDASCAEARALLGPEAIIGVTCRNSLTAAIVAERQGVDYVAFGAFHVSSTKDTGVGAAPEILRRWRRCGSVAAVAIGGIRPDNAAPLLEAGADFLAVSASVWGCAAGPKAAIRAFSHLFGDSDGQDQRQ